MLIPQPMSCYTYNSSDNDGSTFSHNIIKLYKIYAQFHSIPYHFSDFQTRLRFQNLYEIIQHLILNILNSSDIYLHTLIRYFRHNDKISHWCDG